MKAFSNRLQFFAKVVRRIDSWLFRAFPQLQRYGANGNIVSTK
jgi:hypothetical protein